MAVDTILENAREGLISEILHADDLVLMSVNIQNLKEKFLKWKKAFESKGLKVNLKKTNAMVSSSKDEVQGKVDPYDKHNKRVMENFVMCTKCSKWVYGRCAKMMRVNSTLAKGLFVNYVLIQRKELQNQVKKYYFLTRLIL